MMKPYMALILFFLFILIMSSLGCSKKIGTFEGIPTQDNNLKYIKVHYTAWDDSFYGGHGAKAFWLTIQNDSPRRIENSVLIINGLYRADLSSLAYYYGPIKGVQVFRRNYVEKDETLTFRFSHESFNHTKFTNGEGKSLPTSQMITELQIVSKQGKGTWKFPIR